MELRKYLKNETVAEVGVRPPVAVTPTTTLRDTVKRMQIDSVGCILVIENRRLRGIFTERDVLRKVLGERVAPETPIRDLMTSDPEVVEKDDPIERVLHRMYAGGFRHLPVVDEEGEALGTISIKRVVSYLADHFARSVYNLPPEPGRYGQAREGA